MSKSCGLNPNPRTHIIIHVCVKIQYVYGFIFKPVDMCKIGNFLSHLVVKIKLSKHDNGILEGNNKYYTILQGNVLWFKVTYHFRTSYLNIYDTGSN